LPGIDYKFDSGRNSTWKSGPEKLWQLLIIRKTMKHGRGYVPVWAASNAQILVQDEDFPLSERFYIMRHYSAACKTASAYLAPHNDQAYFWFSEADGFIMNQTCVGAMPYG